MLTVRETATVLAALRRWQDELRRQAADLTDDDRHFDDVTPLTSDEIDGLCDWLNAAEPCSCEQPGHFASGIPGILAHLENGRLVPGTDVQRCDLCQRYPTDEAARAKLLELGLA